MISAILHITARLFPAKPSSPVLTRNDLLNKHEAERRAAIDDYKAAKARRDTRGQNMALRRARQATTEALRVRVAQ